MIDEPCGVAPDATVDHRLRVDREEEGVVVVGGLGRVASIGFLVRDALSDVLDDGRAFPDRTCREHSRAVDWGTAEAIRGFSA